MSKALPLTACNALRVASSVSCAACAAAISPSQRGCEGSRNTGGASGAPPRPRLPVQPLQRTQSAATVLHVQLLERVRLARRPLGFEHREALRQVNAPPVQELTEAMTQLTEQGCIARHQACVQQGGERLQILAGGLDRFPRTADGVPNLETGVPEWIEDPLRAGWQTTGMQQHQVNIGIEAQLATAVATDGHQRQPATLRQQRGDTSVQRRRQPPAERQPGAGMAAVLDCLRTQGEKFLQHS